MKLSIPESRISRMWVKYLDLQIQNHITMESGEYVIDIKAMRDDGLETSRIIEEATKRFGAEKINEN